MSIQPPAMPPAPRKGTPKWLVFGGAAVAVLVFLAVIGALFGEGKQETPAPAAATPSAEPAPPAPTTTEPAPPAAPEYEAVREGDLFTVAVDYYDTARMRAIFDDIVSRNMGSLDEGGYFVQINCTTGGSAAADNRLANGKFAVGRMGAAQTGLSAGQSEFAALGDRRCPAPSTVEGTCPDGTTLDDEDLVAVATSAALPEGVVVVSAQSTTDSDNRAMQARIVRVCKPGLSITELKDVATAVAVAIQASTLGTDTSLVYVANWVYPEPNVLAESKVKNSDFQSHSWASLDENQARGLWQVISEG